MCYLYSFVVSGGLIGVLSCEIVALAGKLSFIRKERECDGERREGFHTTSEL